MIEMRIHGRGGQGAVVASEILASAIFEEGNFAQSFPAFGVERRGAPVSAYVRMDRSPVLIRSKIYSPNHVIILDSTLMDFVDVTSGLQEDGWIIINSDRESVNFKPMKKYKVATIDASSIALEYGLGSETAPIVNTAILGAFSKVTGVVGIDAVLKAVGDLVPVKVEANLSACRQGYELASRNLNSEKVKFMNQSTDDQEMKRGQSGGKVTFDKVDQMPLSSVSVSSMSWNKTGSWRIAKPVIDYDQCINCMRCWEFCPDISIEIEDEKPVIDYTYCKGCGICAEECPVDAIKLEREVK